ASRRGVPFAALTATEATIYGRYGFGPAARAADLSIDVRRTSWAGPIPPGRVGFVDPADLVEDGREPFARALDRSPGDVAPDEGNWRSLFDADESAERRRGLRAVRYDDADGTTRGFALYTLGDAEWEEGPHVCTVRHLAAADDDAAAA